MKSAKDVVYSYISNGSLKDYKYVLGQLSKDINEDIDDWLFDLERRQADPTKESLLSYFDESIEDALILLSYEAIYLESLMEGESLDNIKKMYFNDSQRGRWERKVYEQDMLAAYHS